MLDLENLAGEAPPSINTKIPGSQEWYMIVTPIGNRVTQIYFTDDDAAAERQLIVQLNNKIDLIFAKWLSSPTFVAEKNDERYQLSNDLKITQFNNAAEAVNWWFVKDVIR
jgi:hypothetical protein